MAVIKKTAVTIRSNGKVRTFFLGLEQKADGKGAILPQQLLNNMLTKMGVQHGDTYTVA